MALRKDRRGMAVLVDALIFLVVLTLLFAILRADPPKDGHDDRNDLIVSYHVAMLSGELAVDDGSLSSATLADYLIAISLLGAPSEEQVLQIERMVEGTIAELSTIMGRTWLVIEMGAIELRFGSEPLMGGDVYANRQELGDGSAVSTLFVST